MDSTAAASNKAQGPFASLHAFLKENAQVKSRMCQGYQVEAQQQAKPNNKKDSKVSNTKSISQKGLKSSLKKVGDFLFSGPEPYPLIMHRKGDSKKGLKEFKSCFAMGPHPYRHPCSEPTIL